MTERLNIGITCFPTFGGSGIIATEVGLGMARRGHRVHFISRALPVRLDRSVAGVFFHEVTESDHPVLHPGGAYPIALASKIIEVAGYEQLDVLHVHYAVPHATSAWMAREVLGARAPKLVTTLHGTDITLVGSDPSYLPITQFSIQKSDAVTVPSAFLRDATYQQLDLPRTLPIDVIPNFVDTERYKPLAAPNREPLLCLFDDLGADEPVLFHVSNFRPLKRVCDVIAIFAEVNHERPSRLILVGDGPDRSVAEHTVRHLGLHRRVCFLGNQDRFVDWLALADVFILPSETESFGLAALEAMSCGVPVVASDVGGLPDVVVPGETGWLAPVGDVPRMAAQVLDLIANRARWLDFSQKARARAVSHFAREPALAAYEAVYRRVLTSCPSSP